MDILYNDNIRPFLDKVETIENLLEGTGINLKMPKIVSCGMQSHGKSSTLESITHISLPKGTSTVTVCPILINLREAKNGEDYARIKYQIESEENFSNKFCLEKIADKIIEYQNEVKKEEENTGKILFEKIIQVEVNRKGAADLTLIDLPGITSLPLNLKEESKEISRKFLKDEENIILLILKGGDEPNNYEVIAWIKEQEKFPNYQKRVIPVIAQSDNYENKEEQLKICLDQLNNLGLENKPFLIINKYEKYNDLSYEEMYKKEIEIINKIPNINNYSNINKGIPELIKHLVIIQREHVIKFFSNIIPKIRHEIEILSNQLNDFPKECQNQKELFLMIDDYMDIFSKSLKDKKEEIKFNDDGTVKENKMKYHIDMEFKKHIKNTEIQISDLLTEQFCNEVAYRIIQDNSGKSILEDIVDYHILIKPKIEKILSGFKQIIDNIFNYMNNKINLVIEDSLGNYQKLNIKVKQLFHDYAQTQLDEVMKSYKKIYYLETENILTYHDDILYKNNDLKKYIIYSFLGKKIKSPEEKNKIKEENKQNKQNQEKEEGNIFGEKVKKKFISKETILETLKEIFFNYKMEIKSKKFDSNEFTGNIKIAYNLEEVSPDDKIINPEYQQFYDEEKYEFIPGYQYIIKEKLNNFIKLITEGIVHLKTANSVTNMISYLKIMLNRDLDLMFLNIRQYLYANLKN